jgi:putative glutamine amidotransferase
VNLAQGPLKTANIPDQEDGGGKNRPKSADYTKANPYFWRMNKLRILFSFFFICVFVSCSNDNDDVKETPRTLTIVLSKQNSSSSYRHFIEKIDSTIKINWINAYETPLSQLTVDLKNADGIILTGGVDIHPALYGSDFDTIRCGTIDIKRDEIETTLLDHALEQGTPCLGVCRGLQFMNVHMGGSLHPHLPDTLSDIHRGKDGHSTKHEIYVTKALGAIDIMRGIKSTTVSHHHQGISRLADNLEAWAIAPDGLIEGIRHPDTTHYPFFIGVQWHPERSDPSGSLASPIAAGFLRAILNKTGVKKITDTSETKPRTSDSSSAQAITIDETSSQKVDIQMH